MRAILEFPDIDAVTQKETLGFDWGKFLPAGVTLTGTPTVTIELLEGTDPSPSSRLVGTPSIGTIPTIDGGSGVTNTAVFQQVANFPGTAEYLVIAFCSRSDGDVASMWTHIKSVAPS